MCFKFILEKIEKSPVIDIDYCQFKKFLFISLFSEGVHFFVISACLRVTVAIVQHASSTRQRVQRR